MAGYRNYSMSNNAVAAYEDGEKPLSKWTKQAIIDEIQDNYNDYELTFDMELFAKLKKSDMELYLNYSSKHHTSSYYNYTDFYSIDYDSLQELTDERIEQSG